LNEELAMPANRRKGTHGIKTIRVLLDGRRVRTPAAALMELSALSNERERLRAELARWMRREVEITARLAEIADKEARLQVFLQQPLGAAETTGRPLPLAEAPRNLVSRELSY
jgi:anti-sigma factor RsiW